MKYCYKCGCQIENDDLFCGNCGAKQNQDDIHPDKENLNDNMRGEKSQISHNNYSTIASINLSSAKDILIKMFINPIYASKKFVEDKDKNTVTAISILSILLYGVLGIWRIKQLFYSTQNIIMDTLNRVGSLYKLFGNNNLSNSALDINDAMMGIDKIKQSIDVPYVEIFFQNCVIFAVLVLIIFIFITVGANINHKQTSVLEMYKISLIVLVPFLYFKAFSILVSYVSSYAGIAIQLIGIIISIGCLFVLVKDMLEVKEDYSLFIVAICFVVTCAAYYICISKFMYSDIQQIITSFKGINF